MWMTVASYQKLCLWSLKLKETLVEAEQLKEATTTIPHHHVIYEMYNGWIVDGRGFILTEHYVTESVPLFVVWDFQTNQCMQIVNESKYDMVFGITELKDKQIVASCVKNVRCWDVVSGQEMWSIDTSPCSSLHSKDSCSQLLYTRSGKEMIRLSDKDTLFFSDLKMMNLKTREISRGSRHIKGTRVIELKNGTIAVIVSGSLLLFRIPTT